jgi:hypothetical protein
MADLEVRKFEDLPKSKQDVYKKKMLKQKVEGAGEKIKEIGKKALEFTPPGQIKKLVDFVKDKTKKKTGIDVNKGDQKDIKVNTGNNGSSAGSSNPKAKKLAGGGRIMLRGGGICKKGMNKNAIGRNS